MLARAVMGRILLAITRHATSVPPAFPHRLCRPPLPTACEHISKQRNTATRRADIAPWSLPRRGWCTRPFQRA